MRHCGQAGHRCAGRSALWVVRPGLWRLEPLDQPQEVSPANLSVNSNIIIFYIASMWEVRGSTHLSIVLFCPHGKNENCFLPYNICGLWKSHFLIHNFLICEMVVIPGKYSKGWLWGCKLPDTWWTANILVFFPPATLTFLRNLNILQVKHPTLPGRL